MRDKPDAFFFDSDLEPFCLSWAHTLQSHFLWGFAICYVLVSLDGVNWKKILHCHLMPKGKEENLQRGAYFPELKNPFCVLLF